MSRTDDETEAGSNAVTEAAGLLLDRLSRLAEDDPAVARALSAIARWIEGLEAARAAAEPEAAEALVEEEPVVRLVQRTLTIGGNSVSVSVPDDGSAPPEVPLESEEAGTPRAPAAMAPEMSLSTVAQRARLKAECCDWAIERQRRRAEEADFEQAIKPTDQELAEKLGRLPRCRGWPLDPYAYLPDDRTMRDAAGCYRALADAVELADRVRVDEPLFDQHGQRAYELLAECCSALKAVLHECDQERDADQCDAFQWLKERTFADRTYIERHMRLEDPAEPDRWPDRIDEMAKLAEGIDEGQARAKEKHNLLGRIGYIAERWEDYEHDQLIVQARNIDEAVTRLVELKTRPSDKRLRDSILKIADDLPEGFEAGRSFSEVLRFVDEYAARRESEGSSAPPAETPTEDLQKVRELLADQVVVLIGGECRPQSRDALCRGLNLRELRWISTRAHQSISSFEPQVRRPEVRVVLLAIRWSSHSFSDIKEECDRAGKPFVRLPRGYGVNQVARQIVAQVSEALAED